MRDLNTGDFKYLKVLVDDHGDGAKQSGKHGDKELNLHDKIKGDGHTGLQVSILQCWHNEPMKGSSAEGH